MSWPDPVLFSILCTGAALQGQVDIMQLADEMHRIVTSVASFRRPMASPEDTLTAAIWPTNCLVLMEKLQVPGSQGRACRHRISSAGAGSSPGARHRQHQWGTQPLLDITAF